MPDTLIITSGATVRMEMETRRESGIFTTRSYIDPIMMALQGGVTTSNFEVVKLASFLENGDAFFNDIAKFQVVDYSHLRSLQYDEPGDYGSVEKKMNWLCNHYPMSGAPSRPYWQKVQGQTRFGTILFGRQQVKVETIGGTPVVYTRYAKYPARDTKEYIDFYHVEGTPRSQMGSISHASHPWYIQQCTAIEGGKPTDTPRGAVHYHNVWNDEDYPPTEGTGNYIAVAFLQ